MGTSRTSSRGRSKREDPEVELEPSEVKAIEDAAKAEAEAEAATAVALAEAEKSKRDGEEALATAKARAVAMSRKGVPVNKLEGDIQATCLKSAPMVSLGTRTYSLAKGTTIDMHPSHAKTLEQKGWVIARG